MQQQQEVKESDRTFIRNLQSQVTSSDKRVGLDTSIFELSTLIGGMGDIIGREYDLIYENGKVVKVIQKPMRVSTLLTLFHEASEYNKRQEKTSKPKGGSGRRVGM